MAHLCRMLSCCCCSCCCCSVCCCCYLGPWLTEHSLTSVNAQDILHQTEAAVQEAHLVLFMVDAREGITPFDKFFANWLRKRVQKSKVIVVANKCEGDSDETSAGVFETYSLGFGDPVSISAYHNHGMDDLYYALCEKMKRVWEEHKLASALRQASLLASTPAPTPAPTPANDTATTTDSTTQSPSTSSPSSSSPTADSITAPPSEDSSQSNQTAPEKSPPKASPKSSKKQKKDTAAVESKIKFAIIGQPNAGKSTLVNSLLGQQRVLTGPQPGITR